MQNCFGTTKVETVRLEENVCASIKLPINIFPLVEVAPVIAAISNVIIIVVILSANGDMHHQYQM